MAGLPPGDPQLVSMIVSHLKTQGLFDQFRRDCLADVDTKPAYLNLKQRVDNFVSNHLSNHTWSPHLNKNQLRNNIRQLVLQSGMLEQGVDRIVAQVVDPKINHIFRPQVERVVREFLSPGSCSEEPLAPLPPAETKPDASIPEQASSSAPSTVASSSAMSILDTITTLNQEASVRASSVTERGRKGQASDDPMQQMEEGELDMSLDECDIQLDGKDYEDAEEAKLATGEEALVFRTEDPQEQMDLGKEELTEEVKMEEEESETQGKIEEEKDNPVSKIIGKQSEERHEDDQLKSTSQAKQKARERIKEEYSLEDSDLDGLSDITVSSVHTSDLSSFDGESEDDALASDSSEEGELPPDDEGEWTENRQDGGDTADEDRERKPRRKAYVHKPFLYSRYYSDSDDEITVEERRRSAAKDKEERLLKRQQNRERMEEKRKQKAVQAEEQEHKKQKSGDSGGQDGPRAKEARKERKVLEKKMALSRRRKLDSRKEGDSSSKKKGDPADMHKKAEVKTAPSKTTQPKLIRHVSESASSDERHRRTSGSVSEDSSDTKKLCDKGRTHSFILDLEQGSQEALKQRSVGKFDRLSRKELHPKERKDKERSLSDERAKLKQKLEKKSEHQTDESQQKEFMAGKVSSEEKGEKKPKVKSEKKVAGGAREGKVSLSEGVAEEGGSKDAKKVKAVSAEAVKAEKDKEKDKSREKDKDKIKEKEKAKGEKPKSDFKPLLRPDSGGSSEDRSDMEPGSDSSKKKEKHSKELLKRSKSHSEDRPGDKPKSKTDSEKEKTKADLDSQKVNKSSSETDKDPKRVKPTEKGKILEKSKSKSKDEAKTPLLSKTEKKVQIPEVKSAAGACITKPEATKEKKKEANAKEPRKLSEEPSQDKMDIKTAKKKLEKKEKVSEKKDDSQEEKKAPREDKLEKSDKSSKSSVSSLSLEADEPPKKQALLQDTSTDSEPVTTTVTTSFSDDTCDALSDITPEPPEGETEARLSEMPAVPAEADALLTLMDVCTSAEARLPPESVREDVAPEMELHEARLPPEELQEVVTAEMELQEADMKMKEAALTLLSMDPDSTVPSGLICQDTREESVVDVSSPQPMETPAAEEEQQIPAMEVETATETEEFMATEPSPVSPQQTAELEDKSISEKSESSDREVDASQGEASETLPPQEEDAASNNSQTPLDEEEIKSSEIPPEAQPDEELAAPAEKAADVAVTEAEEPSGSKEDGTDPIVSDTTELVSEISSEQIQTEPAAAVTTTSPQTEDDVGEENQAGMEIDNSEAESKTAEEENVSTEKGDPETMEICVPDQTEEVKESEPEAKLVKQISNASSTDSQEDEKGSDLSGKEEKTEGRGRRKRKLSTQKAAAVKESGDEKDEKESKEQLSAEEAEQEKAVEVKTPRRGRSSRATEEAEKDQSKEPEKPEETPSRRGRRSGAAAKDATADAQNKSEDSADNGSSLTPAEKDDERAEEDSEPNQSCERGSEVNLSSPGPEESEGAERSDSKETADTCEPAEKRQKPEEVEEPVEEPQTQEELKESDEQEQSSQQPDQDSGCSPSVVQSEGVEDGKEESSSEKKADETEEEQQQEDQETSPKRPARRGRPLKAAATEDSEKKDKKAEEKEGEQNDEEEEDGDKEEGEKGTATRATTRLASRLEAERNKPSKPSTRASRQNGKEEATAGTRGTRGQAAAAAKGGRKREASPPAVRTRAGQKSEEPPSKRAKR
ncbi:biorientation of chromosomes in cell division protein 1-like 1 isoform X2 [Mugil cephalus]|uniref:biorientation of chromosomes in cell division protein 1-like 1 isoform X2 n=1 Tax=Mugil cephalus TaxID=48193 RepID=UPI001FB606B4|nr:biorientation of chromosomes in cell division protein 1-like 1 isoform X2 [Mugil cephalus]